MFILKDKVMEEAHEDGEAAGGTEGKETETTSTSPEKSWTETWRKEYAGDDSDKLARLERFNSPNDAFDALIASQNKLRSGELKAVTPFPAEGSEEEQSAWREQNGIPVSTDKYSLEFEDGLVIGEDDQEVVNSFVENMHGANLTNEQVKAGVRWYYEQQEKMEEVRQSRDEENAAQADDWMRAEWGEDYRANFNGIHGLLDTAPEGVKDKFLGGRMADGTAIGSDKEILGWLSSLSRQINPVTTVVPGAGENAASAIEDEISQIEELMRTDRKAYNKDERMQARYRELLDAKERVKKTA